MQLCQFHPCFLQFCWVFFFFHRRRWVSSHVGQLGENEHSTWTWDMGSDWVIWQVVPGILRVTLPQCIWVQTPKYIELLSLLSSQILSVVYLSGQQSAGYTNRTCGNQVEVKQFIMLHFCFIPQLVVLLTVIIVLILCIISQQINKSYKHVCTLYHDKSRIFVL